MKPQEAVEDDKEPLIVDEQEGTLSHGPKEDEEEDLIREAPKQFKTS